MRKRIGTWRRNASRALAMAPLAPIEAVAAKAAGMAQDAVPGAKDTVRDIVTT